MATNRRGKNSFVVQVNVPKETHKKLEELAKDSEPKLSLSKYCAGVLIRSAKENHIGISTVTYAPSGRVDKTGKSVPTSVAVPIEVLKPKKSQSP